MAKKIEQESQETSANPKQESQKPIPAKKPIPDFMKFVFGGLSGMGATMIVQPFDLVKTRMQISGAGSGKKEFNSSFHCFQTVVKNEGTSGLYKGIDAALLRQATYTTTRLGVYNYIYDAYKAKYQKEPNVAYAMLMGVIAGAIGSFIGTPSEVALVRMASDGRLPAAERRNYRHVFNALARMIREEGVTTLWSGSFPTVGRAMVSNMVQLASYSKFKIYFLTGPLKMEEGMKLHFSASMLSGFLTSLTTLPLDIAKTRIQNQTYVDGKPKYRGSIDVIRSVAQQEGIAALWKGFTPYYLRIGPHTVFTFIFLEQFYKAYNKYILVK